MRQWNTIPMWSKIIAFTLKIFIILLAGWLLISLCFWITSTKAPAVVAPPAKYLEKNKEVIQKKYDESKMLLQKGFAESKSYVQKSLKENKFIFNIAIGVVLLFLGRLAFNFADYISSKFRTFTEWLLRYLKRKYFGS